MKSSSAAKQAAPTNEPEGIQDEGRIKQFDRPARLRPEHVLLNPEAPERWWRWEVKDDHPLAKAYDRGQLAAGSAKFTAEDRYGAGTLFRGIWASVHGSGVACSNLHRVSGGSGETRSGDRVVAARDLVKKIHARMRPDNAFIIDRVCGDGCYPTVAVRERYRDFEKHVYVGFCLALDDLIEALLSLGLHNRVARETS